MLNYHRVQELVREYQAKWEIINAGVPEVMVAQQKTVSNVGALIDAQIDLNYDLAADLIRKLNEEYTKGTSMGMQSTPKQSMSSAKREWLRKKAAAQGRSFGFSSK